MSDTPPISVLLAVRDGARYLPECLESIRAQTFTDYELVVVEDFSSDATPELLAEAAARDTRLRVIRNPRHQGLTRSLNIGLGQARGRFIARLDADDLMEPQRLAIQYARMREDPSLMLLGSEVTYINETGQPLTKSDPCPPLTDAAIRWILLFDNAFYHSSVLFRRLPPGWPQGVRYDEAFRYGQDRSLWPRLLTGGQGANLAEPLTRCRIHANRISATTEVRQARQQQGMEAAAPQLLRYLPDREWHPQDLLALKQAWYDFPPPPVTTERLRPYHTLLQLFLAFESRHSRAELAQERAYLYAMLLSLLASHPLAAWRSGLFPTLLTRAPLPLLHALARKLFHRGLRTGEN